MEHKLIRMSLCPSCLDDSFNNPRVGLLFQNQVTKQTSYAANVCSRPFEFVTYLFYFKLFIGLIMICSRQIALLFFFDKTYNFLHKKQLENEFVHDHACEIASYHLNLFGPFSVFTRPDDDQARCQP